jgi:hypothetical protein
MSMTLLDWITPDDAEPRLPGFDVQEQYKDYWYLCCRACKLTWHLPKDPARRSKDAMAILATHAAMHHDADDDRLAEPPKLACRACGGTGGVLEHATYVGAPVGGVPVHHECLAAFFKQLDDGLTVEISEDPEERDI